MAAAAREMLAVEFLQRGELKLLAVGADPRLHIGDRFRARDHERSLMCTG